MKTTAARLSALYLLLFALCAIFLVFYITAMSERMLTAQTRDAISREVAALDRYYRSGGISLLVRFMEQRAGQPGANLYLIADPAGQILGGNVEGLAPGILDHAGWIEEPFTYRRYGEQSSRTTGVEDRLQEERQTSHRAIAQIFHLPNGMILLVGRDLGEPEQFRNVVRRALVLALAIMAVGGFLIWFLVGRRALKRIDAVSLASQRIMGGDLSGRLPVTGAGDEFDRLSENLNNMLTRIADLRDGLRQVSDNIAHDLKTPLTRLRNRAESTLSGATSEEDYCNALESAIAESDQLIRVFNAILMISRLEADNSVEATGVVELADIVSDVVELYEPVAHEAGVVLTAANVEKLSVSGNRELIGQSLSNIVDNAIKYTDGRVDAPRVEVSLVRKNETAQLVVADNGPGIAEEDRERVTERFVRLEESRNRAGSGLGLSLVKAVMKFHGGALHLMDNEPGLRVEMCFSPLIRQV